MDSAPVLKVPRSDGAGCLLARASSTGTAPFDLRLVATEGQSPYVCDLRHGRVASLRAKNCPVSEQEWEQILGAVLHREQIDDIQADASVQAGVSASLTIRKQVKGITQRLGSITLRCDEGERIELFEWCTHSLDALYKANESTTSLAVKAEDQEAELVDLRAQLEALMQAKKEDEAALLLKFRDLLNEKKIKIREQQAIIASLPRPGYCPAESGPMKRKLESIKSEEDSEDDGGRGAPEAGTGRYDPGDTSDATASEAGDDDEEQVGSNSDIGDRRMGSSSPNKDGDRQAPSTKPAAQAPPPPRKLPFAANNKAQAPPPPEEETESDDEL
ncbi:hypothetical protein L249_2362 [Ophiocordyceps polyrhachis-furcata BCC 54312]|uniref:Uncharacterized protein n=1 Tax=Ophiocordyceps polyrhachis-furcata BCC 54312 TaxID=1330021 RepID=A0A367LRS9_9HYPO|nr:hypothetical protein L249_2362 [Ophiocordyceps polyrhachis-furcata BCC 54312]